MEVFDNINKLVRDDLKDKIKPGSKVSIAAACFSMYAYKELKRALNISISGIKKAACGSLPVKMRRRTSSRNAKPKVLLGPLHKMAAEQQNVGRDGTVSND